MQGIFEVENGGGLFLASNYLVLNMTTHCFRLQSVNLTANPRKPFGTLMVSFHRLTHLPLKTQPSNSATSIVAERAAMAIYKRESPPS